MRTRLVSNADSHRSEGLVSGVLVADRFRLVRELGRGGMGAVWLAHHEALDVPCAIKFILEHRSANEDTRARFQYEARAAAKLRSPNVVQILDYGVWGDIPYIAMERLVGETLTDRLDREGRLSLEDTHEVIAGVARALTRAVETGIVHRDLKPDNIFLVRDGRREIVKVLDFGVAKSVYGDDGFRVQTITGAILGTPYYLSPEQAHGSRSVDHRSDLWSLAVIAYECLTGDLPFYREGLGDLLSTIMHGDIPVPSDTLDTLPSALDLWWARATAREPDARFQTAAEMADAFALIAGGACVAQSSQPKSNTPSRRSSSDVAPAPTAKAQGDAPTLASDDTVAFTPNHVEQVVRFQKTLEGQAIADDTQGRGRWGLLAAAVVFVATCIVFVAWSETERHVVTEPKHTSTVRPTTAAPLHASAARPGPSSSAAASESAPTSASDPVPTASVGEPQPSARSRASQRRRVPVVPKPSQERIDPLSEVRSKAAAPTTSVTKMEPGF